jgi:hypothetical protein
MIVREQKSKLWFAVGKVLGLLIKSIKYNLSIPGKTV